MQTLDYILLALLLCGAVYGFVKGFVKQIAGLVSIYVGFLLAELFSGMVSKWLAQYIGLSEKAIHTISFVLVIIVVIVVFSCLARLLTKLLSSVSLGLANRMAGAFVSLLSSALILSVLLLFFEQVNSLIPMVDSETIASSKLYAPVKGFLSVVAPFFKGFLC